MNIAAGVVAQYLVATSPNTSTITPECLNQTLHETRNRLEDLMNACTTEAGEDLAE